MSRRWRIETALAALLRERGIATLDELITILVMGREPALADAGGRGAAQQRNLFLPRPRAVRPACSARPCRGSRERARRDEAAVASGRPAARPARKPIRWRCCSPSEPARWPGWTIDILGTDVSRARDRPRARAASTRQFEVQRGLGGHADDPLVRGDATTAGARSSRCASTVRFQVHNLLEPPPHPGHVRHHPVPQRAALFRAEKRRARLRPARRGDGAATAG